MGASGTNPTAAKREGDMSRPVNLHSPFSAIAARANYVSADRPVIHFAAKEICRWMAEPTELAMAAHNRLGGFATYQDDLGQLELHSDID